MRPPLEQHFEQLLLDCTRLVDDESAKPATRVRAMRLRWRVSYELAFVRRAKAKLPGWINRLFRF